MRLHFGLFLNGGTRSAAIIGGDAFFANNLAAGWYGNITPPGEYVASTQKTWIAYQSSPDAGVTTDARVTAHDHSTGAWSPEVIAGSLMLADTTDTHDVPSICVANGHGFIFYGSHNDALRISSTVYPNDPTVWASRASLGVSTAYPHPTVINNIIHLISRNSHNEGAIYVSTDLTDGIPTWAAPVIFLDVGNGVRRFYNGTNVARGNDIHIVFTTSPENDSSRTNIYYAVIKTNGAGTIVSVDNFDGSVSTLAASFPMNMTLIDTSYRIYQHTGGANWTFGPDMCFDAADHPHVVFSAGVDGGPADLGDLLHLWHNGTAWQTVDVVLDNTYETGGPATVLPGDGGTVEVWWTKDVVSGFGGDIRRKIWTAGSFGSEQVMQLASGVAGLGNPKMIRNGHQDLAVIFKETYLTTPDDFGDLKAFAHGRGSRGILRRVTPIVTLVNAEAAAYIARLSVAPSDQAKILIDNMFTVLKDIGIAKFDVVQPYALVTTAADALLNALSTSYTAVNNGATFTSGRGWLTDGAATWLDTGFNPTLATAFTQNSAHVGMLYLSTGQVANPHLYTDGTDGTTLAPRNTSDNLTFRINQAATSTSNSNTSPKSFYTLNRSASGATQVYKDVTARTVNTNANQTSTALNDHTLLLGRPNDTLFTAGEVGLFMAGSSLTAAEVAKVYNRIINPIMTFRDLF